MELAAVSLKVPCDDGRLAEVGCRYSKRKREEAVTNRQIDVITWVERRWRTGDGLGRTSRRRLCLKLTSHRLD